MRKTSMDMNNIPKDKFRLVNDNRRLSDQKFEDKPIGYFKDAWIRFRKNKGVSAWVAMYFSIRFWQGSMP